MNLFGISGFIGERTQVHGKMLPSSVGNTMYSWSVRLFVPSRRDSFGL